LVERSEAHLNIELRELRLSISAEIFVTKTVRDLKVLIEPCDHAQLFEELRRLRQGEELPGWTRAARCNRERTSGVDLMRMEFQSR
jgi:hypothetical protein